MAPITYSPPVNALLQLGEKHVRPPEEWPDYAQLYGLTAEHIPDLIQMAIDQDLSWADAESQEVWAPVHAWRALGQLRAEAAIEPLLSIFNALEEDDWLSENMPDVFALIGSAAIPPVQAFLANPENVFYRRWTAASILVKLGQTYPEARTDCVAALEQQLEQFSKNSPDLNGVLVSSLMDLGAKESAPLMERAFAAKRVDPSIAGDWLDAQSELGLISQAEIYDLRRHGHAEKLRSKTSKVSAKPTKGFGAELFKKKKKR